MFEKEPESIVKVTREGDVILMANNEIPSCDLIYSESPA